MLEGKKKKKARFFENSHWSEPVPLAQVRTDVEPIRYKIGAVTLSFKGFFICYYYIQFLFLFYMVQ